MMRVLSWEKRDMRTMMAAALGAALAGCSDISVLTFQDPKADFSSVKTWAWFEAPGETPTDPEISELARRRIRNMISSELEARGYAWAPGDRANILVKWVTSLGAPVELSPVSFRFGEPVDPAFPEQSKAGQNLKEGSIAIDVIENKPQRRIFWRSIVEGTVDRSQPDPVRQDKLAEAVSRAMASFPSRR